MAAQPELPEDFPWPARTVAWWATWRDATGADTFTATDWDFLLDTALIHADVWGNWNLDRLPELRQRVAKFGATPADRAALKSTATPAPPEQKGTALDELKSRRAARVSGSARPAGS